MSTTGTLEVFNRSVAIPAFTTTKKEREYCVLHMFSIARSRSPPLPLRVSNPPPPSSSGFQSLGRDPRLYHLAPHATLHEALCFFQSLGRDPRLYHWGLWYGYLVYGLFFQSLGRDPRLYHAALIKLPGKAFGREDCEWVLLKGIVACFLWVYQCMFGTA